MTAKPAGVNQAGSRPLPRGTHPGEPEATTIIRAVTCSGAPTSHASEVGVRRLRGACGLRSDSKNCLDVRLVAVVSSLAAGIVQGEVW